MIRPKTAAVFIAIIIIALTFASLRVYYVRDQSNGSLLWNDKEAYAFIGVVEYGYNFSYMGGCVKGSKQYFLLERPHLMTNTITWRCSELHRKQSNVLLLTTFTSGPLLRRLSRTSMGVAC